MVQLSGIVLEAWSRQPIRTAVVVVNGVQTMTDINGQFSVEIQGELATIHALHQTHETLNVSVQVPAQGGYFEFQMKPIGRAL